MDIQPANAAIELGHIWFGPNLRRSRAATEAMFLLLDYAATQLGYRRLVWKCNALNHASCRAAERLGFKPEGVLRHHMVVKGRVRDTAYFSILGDEWRPCADAIRAWLHDDNFDARGNSVARLNG
jgi:RimJ/RimL family protein N-acetyltransferase